jgi:hypothetical protein
VNSHETLSPELAESLTDRADNAFGQILDYCARTDTDPIEFDPQLNLLIDTHTEIEKRLHRPI